MFDPIIGMLREKWLKNNTPQKKLTAALLVFSLFATAIFFIVSGSAETSSDPLESTPLYFVGVLVKLIGVLLLIVIMAVLFRRWMYLGPQGKAGRLRQLRLLETVRLSPKQTLYLVAVGDQQLLIGATDQSISLLSPIESSFDTDTNALTPLSMQADGTQLKPGLDFGSLVQSFDSNPQAESFNGKE
jgi:flagellar biosynthetic protein FliO